MGYEDRWRRGTRGEPHELGRTDAGAYAEASQGSPSLCEVDEISQSIFDEIAPLTSAFTEAGFGLYLVGGIVRDLHLGVPIEALDFDLTTEARPSEIKDLVAPLSQAVWSQGERFGTIGCRIGDRPYEITTHRAESYVSDSRKPEVVFGDDLEVDLSRRDFTINAMAIRAAVDSADAELIDPFAGRDDLESRLLRTPIEPDVSFTDDPLRILRAARFIARYGLTADATLVEAAKSLIDRMSIVSRERVRDEFDKLLMAGSPSGGLEFLRSVGAWEYIAESVPTDELEEIGVELDRAPVDLALRRNVVFSHSPSKSRSIELDLLRYSTTDSRSTRLVLAGLDFVRDAVEDFEAPTLRRLIARIQYRSVGPLLDLIAVLDVPDHGFAAQFATLDAEEDLSDLSPTLDGADVMEVLGLEPGPEVGAALGVLRERRLEEGPLDRQGELDYLFERYKRLAR